MLAIMIVALVDTYGAELMRRLMGTPGSVRHERIQLCVFGLALLIPNLLRLQYGYLSPVWLVGLLAILALLITAWDSNAKKYWFLTMLLLLVNLTLTSTVLVSAEALIVAGLAVTGQLAIAILLRRRQAT